MKFVYKGFSPHQYEYNKSFIIKDIDVVNRDLRNHIFTRKGERVMMSNFGTRIPDILFEPLTIETLGIIYEDMEFVFKYDPRVELINLIVTPFYDEQSVVIYAHLNYLELNLNDKFEIKLEFERT